jgi:hypothetical protein
MHTPPAAGQEAAAAAGASDSHLDLIKAEQRRDPAACSSCRCRSFGCPCRRLHSVPRAALAVTAVAAAVASKAQQLQRVAVADEGAGGLLDDGGVGGGQGLGMFIC